MDNPTMFEVMHLPWRQKPKGGGWRMYSGNGTHNVWYRPGRLLRAVVAYIDGPSSHGSSLQNVLLELDKVMTPYEQLEE